MDKSFYEKHFFKTTGKKTCLQTSNSLDVPEHFHWLFNPLE